MRVIQPSTFGFGTWFSPISMLFCPAWIGSGPYL